MGKEGKVGAMTLKMMHKLGFMKLEMCYQSKYGN